MRRVLLLVLTIAACRALPAPETPSPVEDGLESAYKWVQGCGEKDLSLCLKMRALTYVDKALRRPDTIELTEGVALVRTSDAASREYSGRAISEAELDATLPKDAEAKDTTVENMLVDRVARFFESHTLQLKVPDSTVSEVRKSLDEGKETF